MPASAQARGEGGVLGQKAVAGVDGIRPGAVGDLEDGRDVEVGDRRVGGDAPGLVGETGVQGIVLAVAVDGDRAQAELARGADDAHGDFAAVGDEEGRDRGLGGEVVWHGGDDSRC